MTPELWMLLASAFLLLVVSIVPAIALVVEHGLMANVGNRDLLPPARGFRGRALRAAENLKENLFFFVIAVVAANLAHVSNAETVLGARLFVGARVVHAVAYWAGVPWIRTLAYWGGLLGVGLIVAQLAKSWPARPAGG